MIETERDLALQIIEKRWGPQFRFVGPSNTAKILAKVDAGEPPDQIIQTARGGLNNDLAIAMQAITDSLLLIKICIEIYQLTHDAGDTENKVKQRYPALIGKIAGGLDKLRQVVSDIAEWNSHQ